MRFISTEDFNIPPYELPAKILSGNTFPDYAARKEEEILREILGDLLYEAFIEAWDDLPDLWQEDEIYALGAEVTYGSSTWTSLVAANTGNTPEEGASWTVLEEDNRWLKLYAGVRYTDTSGSKSYRWKGVTAMLIPYIYSQWLNDKGNGTPVSAGANASPKLENSEAFSPITTVVKEFNNFSAIVGNRCDLKNTLYGYLFYSQELYLDVIEGEYSNIALYLAERFQDPGEMNPLNL